MTEVLTPGYQRAAFAAGKYLRIVNWHNTPESQRGTLKRELRWYLERYHPVLPADLDRFTDTGRWALPKPGFIPVFYDSYLNNATVALPVCEELGLTAWFFPTTAILSLDPDDQEAFADAHDYTILDEEKSQPRFAMTWDDLDRIHREGHVICAHTANHAAAKDISTDAEIEREILGPIRELERLTGYRPPAFAFLYGTPPHPGTAAGAAVLASGVRYATTNTAYLRIND